MESAKDLEKQLRELSQSGPTSEVASLISSVDLSATDTEGFTALHYAAASDNKECVELLISKGAKVNCVSNNGCTPLYVASQSGYIDTVTELLSE